MRKPKENRIIKFIKDNGLSLVLGGLFVLTLAGESVLGWKYYNTQQSERGAPIVSLADFLKTGTFLDATFVNWQAALLQLAALILLSAVLFQRGASHSRNPDKHPSKEKQPHRGDWIYDNSLAIAFVLLTVTAFVLHIMYGTKAFNEERTLQGQRPLSISEFLGSSKFWFSTLQTWQAEFFAILLFIVLSIFLRQDKSAESKPVGASNEETGGANE